MKKRWKGLCALWMAVLLACGLPEMGRTAAESAGEQEVITPQDNVVSGGDAVLPEPEQTSGSGEEVGEPPLPVGVRLPKGEGYLAAPVDGQSSMLTAGDSYTFTVSLEPGYLASQSFAVAANGRVLDNLGEIWEPYKYTIDAISENQEVTVTGVVPGAQLWHYTGSGAIAAGAQVAFEEVQDAEVQFGVALNGQGIVERPDRLEGWTVWSCDSGFLIDQKVKECAADGVVSAEDYQQRPADGYLLLAPVWKTLYSVSKADVAAGGSFTVTNGDSEITEACEGELVTVTPLPDTGYAPGEIVVTADGGGSVAVSDQCFSMPGASVTVAVAFEKQCFAVTLPAAAGYTAAAADGQESTVEYGGSFTFTVTLADGYTASDAFAVAADDVVLTPSGVNGKAYTYTIESVTGARMVTVTGVEKLPDEGGSTTPGEGDGSGSETNPPDESGSTTPGGGDGSGGETNPPDEGGSTTPGGGDGSGSETNPPDEGGSTTPGEGDGSGESTPGSGESTPGSGESTPGGGDSTPGGGDSTSGGGDSTPGGEDSPSDSGDHTSGSESLPDENKDQTTDSDDPSNENPASGGTISGGGMKRMQAGTAYVFGKGTWKVSGDETVYQGGTTFYVPADGDYVFEKQ